tara:strand:- start:3541 stop:3990 length:450 start_codon:yes stop_codon:yes gene_type:complete
MLSITIDDIKKYEPNILDYGIDSFEQDITEAAKDVTRDLRIRWWPSYANSGKYDISVLNSSLEMDDGKLTASQFTRAVVYFALGYHIMPKLSSFNAESDLFERKFEFYRKEYSREFEKVVLDGVEYDLDSSGSITNSEKEPTYYRRLKR